MEGTDLFKNAEQIAEKTLKEFNDVSGLDEIINGTLNLKNSKIYEKVYGASKKDPNDMTSNIDSADDLLKLKQVKLASENLKEPVLYLPPFTDIIIFSHFKAFFAGLLPEIYYAYAQKKLDKNSTYKEHLILERLMSLLDDFDKLDQYQAPDKEFYQRLRKIKWNIDGKKLFEKLSDLKFELSYEIFGSGSSAFRTGENFSLTFLAACNAVHQDRNRILKEDVIRAYKTYLKLLNTDISKMGV